MPDPLLISENPPDLEVWGTLNTVVLFEERSEEQEWVRTIQAGARKDIGVVILSTLRQRNPDGSWMNTEVMQLIPGASIHDILKDGEVIARQISSAGASKVQFQPNTEDEHAMTPPENSDV